MNKNVMVRVFAIGLISLLLWIPLQMVRGVIQERASRQQQAREAIAEASAGEQRIVGPFLGVSYRLYDTITEENKKGDLVSRVVEITGEALFPADAMTFTAAIPVEEKYKGIYKALQFRVGGKIDSTFSVPPELGLQKDKRRVVVTEARVLMPITDLRGLRSAPKAGWNGADAGTVEAVQIAGVGNTLAFAVPVPTAGVSYPFSVTLDLIGTTSLGFAPSGKTNKVSWQSAWPHPGFGGRFLPIERSVDANGFTATWTIPHLATKNYGNVPALYARGIQTSWETLDVGFVEPANLYQQAERAAKYGMLFVVLTFAGFFLYEVTTRLRIHPMQYLLVGLTLAIFFLLLIAASEHIAFNYAYVLAALACTGLNILYMAHVLGSWKRAMSFGGALAILYGVLYGILASEDNALIMGSMLLFIMLALIMLTTRRVDWFALAGAEPQPTAKESIAKEFAGQ